MKILIAGNDPAPREVVRRVLADFTDAIFEAEDGIEALDLLERETPDLLVTDLEMPGLDGEALIRAVRAGADTSAMPVICTSPCRDRTQIERLIALRIDEYILQPFTPHDAHQRFKRVLERAATWRAHRAHEGQLSVLLIDPDPNFRAFFRPFVEGEAPCLDAATSAAALRLYRDAEEKPTAVLIAQGLPVLNEDHVIQLIDRMARESGARPPRFWLVSDVPGAVDLASKPRLSGVIHRTFAPDAFAAELRRTIQQSESIASALRSHLTKDAPKWLTSATRHAFGAVFGLDVLAADGVEGELSSGVAAEISLVHDSARVVATVVCQRSDAERWCGQLQARDAEAGQPLEAQLAQLARALSTRVQAALAERQFALDAAEPETRDCYTMDAGVHWDASAWVQTANAERLFVGLRVDEATATAQAGAATAVADAGMAA